jgi:hypothetical protein
MLVSLLPSTPHTHNMHYIIILTAKLILPCCFLLPGLLLESLAGHFEVNFNGQIKREQCKQGQHKVHRICSGILTQQKR